jgi:hypothetical protein
VTRKLEAYLAEGISSAFFSAQPVAVGGES